jgi:Flp pilus assembly protein TadG
MARIRSKSEGGFITIWMLGLCVMVIFLAGISFDLWRVFSANRSLSSTVDGVAVAGASGIDEDAYQSSHTLQLDPARARQLAAANLDSQGERSHILNPAVDVTPARITVTAEWQVDFVLLRVLMDDKPFIIHASSTSTPRRSR